MRFLIISIIIINFIIFTNSCEGFYINDENIIEPHEIQHAECTVTAGEVKASAEAKTSKTLKGVCGSDEMQRAFENLELKIERKFEELKILLQNSNVQFNKNSTSFSNITSSSINLKNNHSQTNLSSRQALSVNRYTEVEKLNKTIITGEDLKIFSYYWKIENFTQKLNFSEFLSETSPLFSIFGKTFNIHATFRYLNRDFFHLRLQILSPQLPSKNKFISLNTESGNIFKDINNIVFKHKIAVLNQENPMQDLISQELTNMSEGFTIPNNVLLSNAYLKDDIILIKIYLYF